MGKDARPVQSVCETGILAMLMVKSGLGVFYIKDDDSCYVNMFFTYCFMLYIIYVTLIMRL